MRYAAMPCPSDGHRQSLADLADRADQAALELQDARHASGNRVEHLTCSSIDAQRALTRIADQLRRLRR